MTISERVAALEKALAEAQQRLHDYRHAHYWRKVQVGDTWLYLPNYENGLGRSRWLLRVEQVRRKEGIATFGDCWARLKAMESSPKWVLVGREYRDAIVARCLRDHGYTFESIMGELEKEETW
jgi:hypothetical protein